MYNKIFTSLQLELGAYLLTAEGSRGSPGMGIVLKILEY